jgi:hypothetical protein
VRNASIIITVGSLDEFFGVNMQLHKLGGSILLECKAVYINGLQVSLQLATSFYFIYFFILIFISILNYSTAGLLSSQCQSHSKAWKKLNRTNHG